MAYPPPRRARPQDTASRRGNACRSAWRSPLTESPESPVVRPGCAQCARPGIFPPLHCRCVAKSRPDAIQEPHRSPARETLFPQAQIRPVLLQSFALVSNPRVIRRRVIARNARLRQNAMMSSKTQTLEIASPSSQSVIFYLLCAGFVVNGIVISLIGPILPMFMAKWGLNDSRAGLFSLVQFSGSFIGVLASSALISAKGF